MAELPDPNEMSRFEAFLTPSGHPTSPRFRLINEDAHPHLGSGEEEEGSAYDIGQLASQQSCMIAVLPSSSALVPNAHSMTIDLPAVGEMVGEFRLLASLGNGVRGFVFLAIQSNLANRPVVLKFTPRDGREHLTLAQLRHPSIVPLYYVQDLPERNLRMLCMPYLGGSTLVRLLKDLGEISVTRTTGRGFLSRLDGDQASMPIAVPNQGPARQFLSRASYIQIVCWIGACLADALRFAHERGLVHLDLKPSNILLAADGTPMLLDFHLSQPPIRPEEAGSRWLGGTPRYMSPEQRVAMREIHEHRAITVTVDGRSDVYSLGVILYEMLGGAVKHVASPPHPIAFRRPRRVPVGLSDIIAKCLACDSRDRYPDAASLAEDLRRQLADLPLRGVPNRSLTERWQKWCRLHPHAFARGVMTAVISSALILTAWLIASGDARQRLRQAQSFQSESREHRDRHDCAAAVRALNQGLTLLDHSWGPYLEREPSRSRTLRTELRQQLAQARQVQFAEELHELTNRLRLLYATHLAATNELLSLEHRLRAIWQGRDRILGLVRGALEPEIAHRLRTDLLDLAILWADLRVRLTSEHEAEARRDALRILDEAERLFGASPVLAHERQSHAAALGLTEDARLIALRRGELAPKSAWEHYALGRSLLAAGALEGAALELDRATDLQPQDLWAQFARGICAYRRLRFDAALQAFDICVALSPGTAECYYNRGRAHAALGNIELARRDYDHAQRMTPPMAPLALNHSLVSDPSE
jgi:serine/threonine protein kinase/tetratricopeptide (TPR) repeat protein